MPLAAGQKIGAYEVLAKLGEGGMGEVYHARDTKLKRDVAIKVLPLEARQPIGIARDHIVTQLSPGATPPAEAWQQVDEPTITGRPAGWSPDSRVLYLLLDTDGFRCLWAQRGDASGRLEGKPYAVRHFPGANESNFGTSFGNAITGQGFVIDGTRRVGNVWLLAPADAVRLKPDATY